MRALGFVLALVSSMALAQGSPEVSRGGALKKRAFQTYGTVSLFVDPTGSDSNACTSTGTAACLTLQGAINKVPGRVRHNVTITLAAGTYSGAVTVSGFTIGPTDGAVNGPAFDITGSSTWTNATLGAGSATGTVTTYTAPVVSGAAVTLGALTDSGQSWTANALKGLFVTMTSGASSGTKRVIVGNSATSLELNAPIGTVSAGNTYAIQTPSTILSGAMTVTNIQGSSNATGLGIILENVTLTTSGTALSVINATNGSEATTSPSVFVRTARIVSTAGRAMQCANASCYLSSSPAYLEGNIAGAALDIITGSFVGLAFGYIRNVSTSATAIAFSSRGPSTRMTGGGSTGFFVAESLNSTGGTQGSMQVTGGYHLPTSGLVRPASTQAGLILFQGYFSPQTNMAVVGGAVGYWAFSPLSNFTVSGDLVCTNTTTCLKAQAGGTFYLGHEPSFSGVTNHYEVDGENFTSSFLNSVSPRLIMGVTGSQVYDP